MDNGHDAKSNQDVTAGDARERIQYEYMLYPTPKFTGEPIDESFELYNVIPRQLDNGYTNYIMVFRRPWTETMAAKKRNFPDEEAIR